MISVYLGNRVGGFMNVVKSLFIIIMSFGHIAYSSVYLWQMYEESGESSCCFHMNSINICNPHKKCTKFLGNDLNGILDYIARILSSDKGAVEPHGIILKQVQRHIRLLLQNPYQVVSYRFDIKDTVPFYHDVIAQAAKSPKQSEKTKPAGPNPYLVKLGLIHFVNKKNKTV